uniref:Uncharacterized protein n=1 Tax=Rhizophagus irregularis (strain DAOM 181602 / DAOM 197198 / MUCL 43194) TaxID=747089 RepID=U9SJZ3_RHIID
MKNAFHVPDNHIVQWPNTALSESKVRKFDGSRAKQPDFVISVNYQSQSASGYVTISTIDSTTKSEETDDRVI